MNTKRDLRVEFKDFAEVEDIGTFTGYASVFGNIDSYGDVVERGAFSRTIQHRTEAHGKPNFPILFNHDMMAPIGVTEAIEEDEHGLKVVGRINLMVQKGRETYALMKQGAITGLSIGFRTIKEVEAGGLRHLKELKLYEWSPVVFPANELAMVTNVKGEEDLAATPDQGPGADPHFVHSAKQALTELSTILNRKEQP